MTIFPVLTGWITTYALHSTILLGLALLIASRVKDDQWRETLWKTALVGGLLTATLQATAGYTPLAARWVIQNDPVTAVSAAEQLMRTDGEAPRRDPVSQSGAPARGTEREAEHQAAPSPRADLSGAAIRDRGIPWTALLVGIWLAVAGLLLGRLALQHYWLFRILADRGPVTDGPLPGMLAALRRHAGFWAPVRLTMSAACPTPIALGRSEICIPERFRTDLEPDQQRSVLAHELAHLRRADPLWQLTAGVIGSVFFFQPLNRIARRRLRSTAENLCDDWAVRHTGSALGLARCLTDIASWENPTTIPETTLAMAEGGSPLLRRIERLAEWREPPRHAIQFRSLAAVGLLAIVALAAPAVSQSVSPRGSLAPNAGARQEEAVLPTTQRAVPFQTVDSVIVHPNPSMPLVDRWSWALARGPRSGFWIGWGGGGPGRAVSSGGSPLVSSSGPNLGSDSRRARPLGAILSGSAATSAVAFVFGLDETGKVERIRLRSADAPLDLAGRPLIWLGPASTPESLAQLRRLYGSLEVPDLRAEVAAAFTLHEEQERVIRTVLEVLSEEEDPEVRAEAVQWLPRAQPGTDEIVTALLTVAFEDPTEDVRLEAVDAIADLESERARRALVRIVETHPEWRARSEAAQALERRHP